MGADLASLGMVGEQTDLVVAYLAAISRKAERPFGVVVQSSSAAGKSTLADVMDWPFRAAGGGVDLLDAPSLFDWPTWPDEQADAERFSRLGKGAEAVNAAE